MNDAASAPNEELAIADFWKWFGEVAPALLQIDLVGAYGRELSARLAKLNAEQWEIGPLDNRPKEMFFALSTQGDREQYERNKNIINRAPPIAGWTFLAAKLPKLWERRFIWPGNGESIDANEWRFILYHYEDGMYDVELAGNPLIGFSVEEARQIVIFVVVSELGEAAALNKLSRIAIQSNPSSDDEAQAVALPDLSDHIGSQTRH
jgi:hypothetical protein